MPAQSRTVTVVRVARFTAVSGAAIFAIVAAIAGMAQGAAQTDAQQKALNQLTPAQAAMIKPLLQRGSPVSGGEIHGFVAASLGNSIGLRESALPNAQVVLETASGAVDQQSLTQTNSLGRFRILLHAPGNYSVCASLNGFAKNCSPVTVANQNVTLSDPIALKPLGKAIRGCVTLKDGSAAVRAAVTSYESAATAAISAVNAANQTVAGPVAANASGCYVLPGLKSAAGVAVSARYEQESASQLVPPGAVDPRSPAAVNVVLPTLPPVIASLSATLAGKEVAQAPPGSTLTVTAKAASVNNYPLRYVWADSSGTLLQGNLPTTQWRLPQTNALNLIYVEVSDGHGGAVRASLSVGTGTVSLAERSLAQRFTLINRGNPIGTGPPPPGPAPQPQFQHPGQTFIDPTQFMGCAGAFQCEVEAVRYYESLGVFDASGNATGSFTNFKTWKAAWGFSDDPTKPGPTETHAVYYNNADLQFGRDMHCLAVTGTADVATAFTGVVINVCYVTNYSDATGLPGGDPQTAITNAETNNNPIAAVAMVGTTNQIPLGQFPNPQSSWANNPYVEFIVFAPQMKGLPLDDFVPSPVAVLDSEGAKSVPGVCIACHSGTYSSATHNISGPLMSRFLAFDSPSFLYDSQASSKFSQAAQGEQLRNLNIVAKNASTDGQNGPANLGITSQTLRDLIDGWYSWCGGVGKPSCTIDDAHHAFIPSAACTSASAPATCGWTTSNPNDAVYYQTVPRVYCRTCHVVHSDAFNFQNYQNVKAQHASPCYVVQSYFMPFAQVPYNRFWGSSTGQTNFSTLTPPGPPNCALTPPPQ